MVADENIRVAIGTEEKMNKENEKLDFHLMSGLSVAHIFVRGSSDSFPCGNNKNK